MLDNYRSHVEERAAEGVVAKPLDAQQTADLVELLKNPPTGEEEFILDLLVNRVPAGVDDAPKVRAIPIDGLFECRRRRVDDPLLEGHPPIASPAQSCGRSPGAGHRREHRSSALFSEIESLPAFTPESKQLRGRYRPNRRFSLVKPATLGLYEQRIDAVHSSRHGSLQPPALLRTGD